MAPMAARTVVTHRCRSLSSPPECSCPLLFFTTQNYNICTVVACRSSLLFLELKKEMGAWVRKCARKPDEAQTLLP